MNVEDPERELLPVEQELVRLGINYCVSGSGEITNPSVFGAGEIDLSLALKTLIFTVDQKGVVLAVFPADRRLSYGKLADALGVSRGQICRAPATTLEGLGVEPGGAAPIRTRSDMKIVFDESVKQMGTVWCGSGVKQTSLRISAPDLIRVAGDAIVACIVASA